jgi:hypothetical protein
MKTNNTFRRVSSMPALELKPLEDWPAIVQAADATDVGGEYE